MRHKGFAIGTALIALMAASPAEADELAQRFGRIDQVQSIGLSPDGQKVVIVTPLDDGGEVVRVGNANSANMQLTGVNRADGKVGNISWCNFAANDRLVCAFSGVTTVYDQLANFRRTFAINLDGKGVRWLGAQPDADRADRASQFDGYIVSWLASDGTVLFARDFVPENSTETNMRRTADGIGVVRLNTRTGAFQTIEAARTDASGFWADAQGNIRIRSNVGMDGNGQLTGRRTYRYRTAGSREWQVLGEVLRDGPTFYPLGVDGAANTVYIMKAKDGRDAVYRVALDGTMKEELVFAHPVVDAGGLVEAGRGGRILGVSYTTDRAQTHWFDKGYEKLLAQLTKALPGQPQISFIDATPDEKRLLLSAGTDRDPGQYMVFDRTTRKLDGLLDARPALAGVKMGSMDSITYPAADGTKVPAYLTLPPEGTARIGAIVMPHGGPASRDEWGFDWLVQYFATSGYAVIQPQFRGSSGYGDAWFADNGFKSWKLAIGDVTDAARYLVAQKIAPADKLAIVGWSYGGYAALQSAVVAPDLFKAVIAIAPVADLERLKDDSAGYTNARLVARMIGSGPHVTEGSSAQRAAEIRAPVLMFHGTTDVNVAIGQARRMESALKRAGKPVTLVTYEKLDHQLESTKVRTDMLTQSGAFLKRAMGGQ